MKTKLSNNNLWDIATSIPFYEIAEYMTEEEYEAIEASAPDKIRIQLSFTHSPAEREVGIPSESFDFREWAWADIEYPTAIERAINLYIADKDMEEIYGAQVKESMLGYAEYMKYGERLWRRQALKNPTALLH